MQKTGQKSAMRRLIFNIDCVTKERELVKAGINSFVYESDITNYIENVASKVVKIVELENFSREVPDEIVDIIDRVGHLFDQMYVVFTDYTGEEERKVTAARREKNPILFGSFQNKRGSLRAERFYYLGDSSFKTEYYKQIQTVLNDTELETEDNMYNFCGIHTKSL